MKTPYPEPWRDRHPKSDPRVRCCWVCGKPGGYGFTTMLKLAGYRDVVSPSHAHASCIRRAVKPHIPRVK